MKKRMTKFYTLQFSGTEKEERMFEQVLNHWMKEKENVFIWQKFECLKQGLCYKDKI